MSIISRIFQSYRDSLRRSQERYEHAYADNAQHAVQFYNDFLHQLFIPYGKQLANPVFMNQLITRAEDYFQRRDVHFVAIDGTCSCDPFQDFMVFFSAAYGVKGRVSVEPYSSSLQYKRWSMDEDVSLVAYVPIPYAEAGDITDAGYRDEFTVDDKSKINLSSIHIRLMQLGEIYLAYEMARSSTLSGLKLILMDLSLSSVLMSTDIGIDNIRLFGCPIGTRRLENHDGLIAYAHPINPDLGIPTPKKYRRWTNIVGLMTQNGGRPIYLDDLARETGISEEEWKESLGASSPKHYAQAIINVQGNRLSPKIDFSASWFDTVRLFEDFCDRLFHQRNPEALIYAVQDGQVTRLRWMSPEDISFLVAVGLRALIETCWERGIMLIGIAKDSSARYFSRHYLGIMREIGVFPQVSVDALPWTDRVLLESIAYQVEELAAPWATTEFDSVFMTLHLEEDTSGTGRLIRGVRGNVVNPERLFARSLVQFFLDRRKPTPLMGHVIFVDRLLDPRLDRTFLTELTGQRIYTPELGAINPSYFGTNQNINYGQAISIWLLDVLTRNLFPEVIGYPDPLHKADWGAKSVKRRVDRLIQSSETAFRARPLSRLFRTTRGQYPR